MTLSLRAPAKINLDLRVLAREESGYHRIETLLLMIDLCDRVTVEEGGAEIALEVEGADLGDPIDNLVYRAAARFFAATEIDRGVRITLEKRIPAGAGLGGGSSDAAAVLRLLNHLYRSPLSRSELLELAAPLGADVPFFLTGTGYALGWGRGERLLEISSPEIRWVVLALSGIHISTPDAYRRLSESGLDPGRPRVLTPELQSDWSRLAASGRNDFERVAFVDHPELEELREGLERSGACPARLSGSGSAVFGIFETDRVARDAADRLTGETGVECVVSRTLSAPPAVQTNDV